MPSVSLRSTPTAPACSAARTASSVQSELQTTTAAPVASREGGDEVEPAGHRVVDEHEVRREKRVVVPRLARAAGLSDRLHFRESFEARREPTTVDRVRIDDEELQTVPASLGRASMALVAGPRARAILRPTRLDGKSRRATPRHRHGRQPVPENLMVTTDGRVKIADFGIGQGAVRGRCRATALLLHSARPNVAELAAELVPGTAVKNRRGAAAPGR